MSKTLGDFRNLIGRDEKAIGYRIVDNAGHDHGRVYEFIGPEDMDEKGDIAGAIEYTLHKMRDAGFGEEDIERFLGAVKSDKLDPEFNSEDVTYIDLDYVLPGTLWYLDWKTDLLRKKLYKRFQFFWLAEHNHTVPELVKSVMDYADDAYGDFFGHPYEELVEEWEKECGFSGEVYPCYSEFITSEYLDKNLAVNLCWTNDERYEFLKDPYLCEKEE